MNKTKCKLQISEIISLVKCAGVQDNDALSQKQKAVPPNCQNWLFYCSNNLSYLAIPPYTGVFCLSFMVWLILQNKPLGEYAKRFLFVPRVRPHRPFLGLSTQKQKGVFAMNAQNHTPSNTAPKHAHISQSVRYTVQCKELGIYREFSDFDTAHTFALQLEQDYPQAKIKRLKIIGYFDTWGQV